MKETKSDNIIEVTDISKTIPTKEKQITLFRDLSFSIKRRESVALTGKSGTGKSSLIAILAGLDNADKGNIKVCGCHLEALDEAQRAALRLYHIGFVFQSFKLINTLNSLENVQLPGLLRGESDAHSKQKAQALLADVGLGERMHHFPMQLSGGEQQRVALARAFYGNPQLLFADEPTGNLDEKTSDTIIALLFSLNQQHGTTLFLVTHDMKLAARCERHLLLKAGTLLAHTS